MRPVLLHKKKYELIRELNNLRTVTASLDDIKILSKLSGEMLTGIAGLFGITVMEAEDLYINVIARNIGEMTVEVDINDYINVIIDRYPIRVTKSAINIIEELIVKLKSSLGKTTNGVINIQSRTSNTILIYPSDLVSTFANTLTNTYLDLSKGQGAIDTATLIERAQIIIGLYTLEMIILGFSYYLDVGSSVGVNFKFLLQDGFIIVINNRSTILGNIRPKDTGLVKSNLSEVDSVLANVVGYRVYLLNNHDPKTLSTMDSQTLSQLSGYII